jgi:hypothetical protein
MSPDGLLMTLRPRHPGGLVGDTNGLRERFDQVLWDLITGTARRGLIDDDSDLVEDLQDHIRKRVVSWGRPTLSPSGDRARGPCSRAGTRGR